MPDKAKITWIIRLVFRNVYIFLMMDDSLDHGSWYDLVRLYPKK